MQVVREFTLTHRDGVTVGRKSFFQFAFKLILEASNKIGELDFMAIGLLLRILFHGVILVLSRYVDILRSIIMTLLAEHD